MVLKRAMRVPTDVVHPHTMSDQQRKLYCYLLEREGFFTVNSDIGDTVSDLRDKVKLEITPELDYLPASDLTVWQVSIPISKGDIAEEANRQIVDNVPLKTDVKISDTFQPFHEDIISVVVKTPYPEGERAPKKQKLEHKEKSDYDWLLNWHSTLWGKAKERPFSRTVHVDVPAYKELQKKLAETPPDKTIQVKCDLLNSLPTNTEDPYMHEEEDDPDGADPDVDADADAEANRRIDADIMLPMRITYVDLSDLEPCPHIPQLVLYRPEFDELTKTIQDSHLIPHWPHKHYLTGTPGIGKTVYLHLRIVQMLLEAKPLMYQTCNGKVFHLGKTVTVISRMTIPRELATPSHIFVDFDGTSEANVIELAASIENLREGSIIMASTPGPSTKTWQKDRLDKFWVLRNWEFDQLWITYLFFSPSRISADQFRDNMIHFGLSPRLCLDLAGPEEVERTLQEIKDAVGRIESMEHFLELLDRVSSPNWQDTHRMFEVVTGDSLFYGRAQFSPRSKWVTGLITDHVHKKLGVKLIDFHNFLAEHS